MKCHPEVTGLDGREAFEIVWTFVDWRDDFDADDEEAEGTFLDAWELIRYLPGLSPLENASARARKQPVKLGPETARKRSLNYPTFVALAGWLQVVTGNRNIMLPVGLIGAALHCSEMCVSRYRRWAVRDNYLRVVRRHCFRGTGVRGDATEFRFNLNTFEVMAKHAAAGTAEAFSTEGLPPPSELAA